MKSKMPALLMIATIILMIAGLGYFFANRTQQTLSTTTPTEINTSPQQPVSLKWGGPKNISMLSLVAEDQSLFQKHNLATTFVDIQTGKLAMDALRSGDIDLGILVDSNIAFAGYAQADDLRVLSSVMTKRDDALLVAKEGFNKPSDLTGLTIGVTLGTTSHAYLVQWLQANGMKPSSVIFQNMPPPAIQAALLSGDLKAGCLWQPFRYNVLAAKPGAFVELKDPAVYTSYVLLVGTKRFLDIAGNETAVMDFIEALIEAESHIAKNEEASQKVLGDKLGIPADVMKAIWPEYELLVSLDSGLLELLNQEGKWISESVEEHLNQPIPNYAPFIDTRILNSIDAKRVRGM